MSQSLKPARILMLHGHAESGPVFHFNTRRLQAYLQKTFPPVPSPDAHPDYPGGVELHYPTGPLQLKAPDNTGDCGRFVSDEMLEQKECDLDTWAWGTGDFRQSEEISGLSESVAYMLDYILTYGPFVGVVGFSCGATLAAILASLLEGGRDIDGFSFPANFSHPPLRFAVCYSGFMLKSPNYKSCYQPKIRTPSVHMIGEYDPMTEEAQTLVLADRCTNGILMKHPGTHFVPQRLSFLKKVVDFIEASLSDKKIRGMDSSDDSGWEHI